MTLPPESRWGQAEAAIRAALAETVGRLWADVEVPPIEVLPPTESGRGDLSTNLAFRLAGRVKRPPKAVAAAIHAALPSLPMVEHSDVAGAGFLNWRLSTAWLAADLARAGPLAAFPARGERILIEFVSANPTGPLVVVNGRAAAVGDSLARILAAAGYAVDREYYVNDAGNQILKLGQAMAIRIGEHFGIPTPDPWPEGVYPGDYVKPIARAYHAAHPEIGPDGLGPDRWAELGQFAAEQLRREHEAELERFGVRFDRWFSERELRAADAPDAVIRTLEARGLLYVEDGATWFRSSRFGDQKDRVVVKADGEYTYLVPDAAYHQQKFARGYDTLIDLLGPDHHGYLDRIRAIVEGLGCPGDRLEIQIIQVVRLLRGGEVVRMSKRGGTFVTLGELIDEVGVDPARWFFLERSPDTPMDFDLDLAQLKTQDNPVYYVQYAGARIQSILRKRGADRPVAPDWERLTSPLEAALVRDVARFPAVVARSAEERAPQLVVHFLTEIAGDFHAFYRQHRIVGEEPVVEATRLQLAEAVLRVIRQGLDLIGVSLPESM